MTQEDEHPRKGLVDIERVIAWIKDNRLSFYEGDVLGGSPRFKANKFYNALRKAMEG